MSLDILIFVVIMAIFLVFAVVSNALLIFSILRQKKLRTIINFFICNLSLNDILLAGFVMPQRLHDLFHMEEFDEGKIKFKFYFRN